MARRDPAEAAGLVVVRLWIERASEGAPDGLRARITTAKDPDLSSETTFTVAGQDGVLMVVREFLAELAGDAAPWPPEPGSGEQLL